MGDEQAVRWILHLGLGDELALGAVRLRIIGLLAGSPLQGALLVSDAHLARSFPGHGGRSVFLLRPPPGREDEVARALRSTLGRFGLTVSTIGARMAHYREVENTYLAIFQALGGLGLMLGTLGLGVVLLENVVERRWELAALRAFGFPRFRLAALLLLENGAILALGLILGGSAGLLAAGLGGGEQGPFPWRSLITTFAGIGLAGLSACTLAVRSAMRSPLVTVLKAE
jgi:ABC-type antimicrobial peptide transport system permease subunit